MFTLKVENQKGEILNLTESKNYDVIKVEGLTPPPAILNFSELPNYNGSIYNSGRIGNRNLVIYVKIYSDVETNRINLYKYFKMNQNVRIYYQNATRDVYIDGRVETFECDLFVMNEIAQISIVCENPYWKEIKTVELEFSNVMSMFEFPFAIEEEGIEFSSLESMQTKFIENDEVETGIIIEFRAVTSQILNPKIINRTTQEYFGVNFDMSEGDVIRINTIRGQKSVTLIRDSVETNIINYIQNGSKFIQLASGLNEISYECDEGASNLNVYISALKYYEGV